MTDQHRTAPPENFAIAALRQVANSTTTRSIKQTILACMLVRAVSRPPPRRHTVITASTIGLTGLAIVHWHAWSLMVQILR